MAEGALAGYDPDSGLYLCRQGGSLRALPAATDGVLTLGASHPIRGGLVDGMPAARVDVDDAPAFLLTFRSTSDLFIVFDGWINSPDCLIDGISVFPAPLPGTRRWFVRSSVSAWNFYFRVNFEDSKNCGGANDNTQTAWAFFSVSGLTQSSQVSVNAVGRTEMQASGFDSFSIFELAGISSEVQEAMEAGSWVQAGVGDRIVRRQSLGEEKGCQMRDQEESIAFDTKTRVPEDDGFFVSVSTEDGVYHVNSFWELSFTIT